ncbi:hypothetical protein OV450_0179 [Actinobacteria bacterium OV450]|nr:hypothetical protein OV450_0179 [Actinobacteria bacterium OV450]
MAPPLPDLFAADVAPELAAVFVVCQRPLTAAAFAEAAPVAARRTQPSWGLAATADRTVDPEVERFGYRRAGTTTVEVESSHLVTPSRPERVAESVQEAVSSTAH